MRWFTGPLASSFILATLLTTLGNRGDRSSNGLSCAIGGVG